MHKRDSHEELGMHLASEIHNSSAVQPEVQQMECESTRERRTTEESILDKDEDVRRCRQESTSRIPPLAQDDKFRACEA